MVKHTDARVKLASEIITGIKAIKLYAWEEPYVRRISELRERELKQIKFTQVGGGVWGVWGFWGVWGDWEWWRGILRGGGDS